MGGARAGTTDWGGFKLAREDVPAPIAKAIGGNPDRAKVAVPSVKIAAPKTESGKDKGDKAKGAQGRLVGSTAVHREPGRSGSSGPVRSRVFTIAPSPKRVEVFLDRVKKLDFDVGKEKIEVPWDGTHEIMISNDACCNPLIIEVGPDKRQQVRRERPHPRRAGAQAGRGDRDPVSAARRCAD